MSNYATKADLRNATEINTWDFAKKTDLTNLKFDVDKLDIDKLKKEPNGLNSLKCKEYKLQIEKLETTLVDLSKLNNRLKEDLAKKLNMMNWLKKIRIWILLILVI